MNLAGRQFQEIEPEKLGTFPNGLPATQEQWLAVASLALEVVGIRRAVRLGDQRLWRQAVAELSNLPLPPLNLPLPLWDAYLAAPFSSVKLTLVDGRAVVVSDWSAVYYSWHSQTLAVHIGDELKWVDALEIVSAVPETPQSDRIAILDRLRWLERSTQFVPFVLRTRDGRSFVIEQPNSFRIDDSGALIAMNLPKEGLLFGRISAFESITLLREEAREQMLQSLEKMLSASPFTPFQIRFVNGVLWTVMRAQSLFVTREKLFLAEGKAGSTTQDRVLSASLSWVDRLEVLPQSK